MVNSRRRPSPSMVVALLALVMSCTGTAVAGTALIRGDSLIRKDSLSGNRLRRHTITSREVNLAKLGKVPTAARADVATVAGTAFTAGAATNATTASNADALGGLPATSFAPVIYAHVFPDGTVDTSESKGITQSMVVQRKISAYCFSNLPFTPKGGSATVDYASTSGAHPGRHEWAELEIDQSGSASDCQPGEMVEVSTASDLNTFGPEGFYIVLYG